MQKMARISFSSWIQTWEEGYVKISQKKCLYERPHKKKFIILPKAAEAVKTAD